MVTRFGEDKKRYEMMITLAFKHFEKKGLFVKADHIVSPNGKPDPIGSHVPEIWVKKKSKVLLIAVETCDTFKSENAKFKLQELASAKDALLAVVIPQKCKFGMQEQCKKWGIKVNKFYTFSKY